MKYFFLFIFTTIFTKIFGQEIEFKYSEFTKPVYGYYMEDAGLIDDKINVIFSPQEISSYMYNKDNFLLVSANKITGKSRKSNNFVNSSFDYLKTFYLKNNTIMLLTKKKGGNECGLYAKMLGSNGVLKGNLLQIDNNDKYSKYRNPYFVKSCEDKTKFIVINNPKYDRYYGEELMFKIYDENFKNLMNLGFKFPIRGNSLSIEDLILTNNNEVLLLIKVDITGKGQTEDKAPFYFSLYRINMNSKEIKEHKISIPSLNVLDVNVNFIEKNATILCTGICSSLKNGKYQINSDNVFSLKINNDGKEEYTCAAYKSKPFNLESNFDISTLSGELNVIKTIFHSNGSFTMISEVHSKSYSYNQMQNYSQSSMKTNYFRGYILVSHFNQEGEIEYFTLIRKHQSTEDDNAIYSSFFCFEKNNHLYFIFNDDPDNINYTNDFPEQMISLRQSCLFSVSCNLTGGKTDKKIIFDNKEKKIILKPSYAKEIQDGLFIVPAFTFSGGHVLSITVNEIGIATFN